MSSNTVAVEHHTGGASADDIIASCVTSHTPTSFFLFAGAGSGKTTSLVNALNHAREVRGAGLRLRRQKIGVITYTNAACDEITRRLEFDPLMSVSTIHSFAWLLIGTFHLDIKHWVGANLKEEIAELEFLLRKGRPGTKTAFDRERSLESKKRRLANLGTVRRFTYSPNGDNRGRDSLNHAEVIKIAADFLSHKPQMQSILISRFPILLIDESQDTNRMLMEALLLVENVHHQRFRLGLFGDTMQRIYADGKPDLGQNLPERWAKPSKVVNHRSRSRIVQLINKIREPVDSHSQSPRTDKDGGTVRLFVCPNEIPDKPRREAHARERMALVTGDALWRAPEEAVKTLILEHHMAARRMGFLQLFEPLYRVDNLRTGLLDGSLPGLRLFTKQVLPLINATRSGNDFAAAAIVRNASPLLSKQSLKDAGAKQVSQLRGVREAIDALVALCVDVHPELTHLGR